MASLFSASAFFFPIFEDRSFPCPNVRVSEATTAFVNERVVAHPKLCTSDVQNIPVSWRFANLGVSDFLNGVPQALCSEFNELERCDWDSCTIKRTSVRKRALGQPSLQTTMLARISDSRRHRSLNKRLLESVSYFPEGSILDWYQLQRS
jgi:hypothetical protein